MSVKTIKDEYQFEDGRKAIIHIEIGLWNDIRNYHDDSYEFYDTLYEALLERGQFQEFFVVDIIQFYPYGIEFSEDNSDYWEKYAKLYPNLSEEKFNCILQKIDSDRPTIVVGWTDKPMMKLFYVSKKFEKVESTFLKSKIIYYKIFNV